MKKINLNKTAIAFLALAVTITSVSCNKIKDFGDTNRNPNEVTELKTYAVLTAAEFNAMGNAWSNTGILYAQYASETQYPGVGLYSIPRNDMVPTYTGILLNLKTVMDNSSNPDEIAIAKILTQWTYWQTTDRWGPIPYSEAMKGVTPTYDAQETIYKGIVAELKVANAMFTGGAFVRGDIINGGDINKWKKFANSMRMIMMLQLSKRYPGTADYAATEFRAALLDGGITSNADNTTVNFPGADFKNPFFTAHDAARDNGQSEFLYNTLAGLGDGRQAAYGSSSTPVPYGWKEADINAWVKLNVNWSRFLGDNYRTATSPIVMLSSAETWLARAEAADRGWTSESITTTYTTGINQSFEQWGIALPSGSYFTQANAAITAPVGTGANIKPIAIQRWLASFPDGVQGWNIYRRTGWPALIPARDPSNPAHATIPRRWTYAQNEYDLNAAGVAKGISMLVPATDLQESRIWWDQ